MQTRQWGTLLGTAGLLGLAGTALVSWYTDSVTPPVALRSAPDARTNLHAFAGMHALKAKSTPSKNTQYWTCPMHPQVVLDHQGNCPICGMQLVKLSAKSADARADHASVSIDPATADAIGVAVTRVRQGQLHEHIDTYATLLESESRTVSVTPKFDGWVRQLKVSAVGERVHKGQLLYTLYSPEAQQRQRDYIDLLTRRDALTTGGMAALEQNNSMLASIAAERFRVRDRLLAADIPESVIAGIERDRTVRTEIPVLATQDGVVEAINARSDGFISPAQPVLVYGDPRGAWAEVTLYQDQLGWLREGCTVTLRSDADPGWSSTLPLDAGTAQVDPATRMVRLRVRVPGGSSAHLLAGDVLNAIVNGPSHDGLYVPRDAVVRTGHGNFLMVALGQGHYLPTAVGLGAADRDSIEITSGIAAGSEVVVNGQFLLGAEASIDASRRRMTPSGHEAQTL
ncbi:MAG: efflux RND transporter periplasmic adaptor subunit [Burkholderiales bacterium]|nr:efflux RND transporter periplasmic adaptor subunit [Burkholderiales bacterium]